MSDDGWRRADAQMREEAAIPFCTSDEVAVVLEWELTAQGSLVGRLVVTNIGERICRVGGKPTVAPLGMDGEALATRCLHTMEMRIPPWAVLRPGDRADAPVSWAGWCADAASGSVLVRWDQGQATVAARGPRQPRCPDSGQPTNLSASWFSRVDAASPSDD